MSKKGITRNSWILLKQAWNLADTAGSSNATTCGNTTWENYREILKRYFDIWPYDEDQAIYCLTAKYNYDYSISLSQKGESTNPFENIGPDEVLIPTIFKYEAAHNESEYESEYYQDECNQEGTSIEYNEECECLSAMKEGYDKDGDWYEEDCIDYLGTDDECECREWKDFEIELFWWNVESSVYFSLKENLMSDSCDIGCLEDYDTILFDRKDYELGYDSRETWDYFSDSDYGYIHDWGEEDIGYEVNFLLKD